MSGRSVVILGAARTPIGRYGGALRDDAPGRARRGRGRAALERAGVPREAVDEVLIGHGAAGRIGTESRPAGGPAPGLPDTVPAQTINQACASGLQAVALGAQAILLGESSIVLAGGIESMSRMPYLIDSEDARWGHGWATSRSSTRCIATGSSARSRGLIMGETAEVLARQYGITREESDAFALESQRKAEAAIAAGRFVDEIAPATGRDAKGKPVELDRGRTSAGRHDDRRPAQAAARVRAGGRQPGIITAGTSSGITDGGAAVVLRERRGRHTLAAWRRWRASSAGRRPASIRGSWASARCRRSAKLLRTHRAGARRLRPRRAERGVRAAGARRAARPADCGRPPERQRRRDRARPSDRLHRHAHSRDAAPRDETARRPPRPCDAVRQRRTRHGDGD